MPARRRTIDPETRDYVTTGGDYQDDGDSVLSKALLLWRLERGSAAAFPSLGHRFKRVRTVSESSLRALEQYALEAWEPLVEDGEIRDPQVTAEAVRDLPGVVVLRGSYVNRAGGTQTLSQRVAVGG